MTDADMTTPVTRILPLFPGTQLLLASTVSAGELVSTLPTATDGYLRIIWGLLVVIGIIFIIYGLVRKRFSLFIHSPSHAINIVEMKPLMGKKALCLVKVHEKEYLIGLAENSITLLDTVEAPGEKKFAAVMKQVGGAREP